MSDQPHERRRHFRGKPRPGRILPVRYRATGGEWRTGETRNVGVGGAFIAGVTDLPVGTAIELELSLPSCDHALAMNAIVRRAGTSNDSSEGDIGIGVEFVDVEVDVLLELNDYFASLTGAD
ncbi:MAG TPA: PilZ domain-containing protein [Kofleriaceae bacterium]|nr:PilZ domain-containing protein [Kofleriaceae bacterium]